MHCVICLVAQFLTIHFLLAVSRTYAYSVVKKWEDVPAQRILQDCANTMNHAPMLAALFIAYRLRVMFLTQGKNDLDASSSACIYLSTYALVGATLSACVIAACTGEWAAGEPRKCGCVLIVFTGLKFLFLFLVYGGAAGVIYGIATYMPPPGTWPGDVVPGQTAASKCVCVLACQFFFVYFLTQVLRTHAQCSGKRTTRGELAMLSATHAMNLAPMLAVLFTALRMRSWQLDAKAGRPQEWAQIAFFVCTFCLPAQTFLAFLVPYLMHSEARPTVQEGEETEQAPENYRLGKWLIVVRFAIMAWLYSALGYVTWCVLTIASPKGPELTDPISVTQQCVIIFAWQFLMVYLGVSICQAMKEVYGTQSVVLAQTMEGVRATAGLSPILALLLMAVRMRALTMTKGKGAPQLWAQDAMYTSVWLVLFSIILSLTLPYTAKLPGGKGTLEGAVEGEGEVTSQKFMFYAVEFGKYLVLFVLYGSVVAVSVGAFVMTPDTANGRGSAGLVDPGDPVPAAKAKLSAAPLKVF